MLSWTHRYYRGHQALNHIQPPGWVTGYTFFSLKRQPCVFDIPGSSSSCLWAQGPTCLPQLLCFLIERLAFHVFYRLKKLSYSWFTWLTPTHSPRLEKCTMFYTGEQVVRMTLLWLRNLGGEWQLGQYWTHLQYLPLFYNICLYYIYGLNHLKLITLYVKTKRLTFLTSHPIAHSFSRYPGKHCSLSPGIVRKHLPWLPSTQTAAVYNGYSVWVGFRSLDGPWCQHHSLNDTSFNLHQACFSSWV